MPNEQRRTALSIVVPEAEPLVSDFRRRFAAASVAKSVPAHITVLIPYVAAADLDDTAVDAACEHFASVRPIGAELVAVGRFAHPPYGGGRSEPVPHLTVGEAGSGATLDEIGHAAQVELAPRLPLAVRAAAAWLLVERPNGAWELQTELPFAR